MSQLLQYPRSPAEDDEGLCQAKPTAAGKKQLAAKSDSDLMAGIDYVVKEDGGDDWVPLDKTARTEGMRDEWILRRRRRPKAPHFKGCPLPKHRPGSLEQNPKLTMTYFHPWTLQDEGGGKVDPDSPCQQIRHPIPDLVPYLALEVVTDLGRLIVLYMIGHVVSYCIMGSTLVEDLHGC